MTRTKSIKRKGGGSMPTSFEKELKSFMAARMEQNTTVHRLSSGEFPKPGSGEFEEFVGFMSGLHSEAIFMIAQEIDKLRADIE